MNTFRRSFLFHAATIAGLVSLQPLLTSVAGAQGRTPQPLPSPNAPNPNFPPGLSGPDQAPPDKKQLDKAKQEQVRAEIEKLYGMVFELREQMRQVDANNTLSVSVVKKAQQIEKLAKQIKDLAKG